MKLKDVRKLGIEYCEQNNCSYVCIAYDNIKEFYLTEDKENHTVFFVNKNGSLHPCRSTDYALDFHKELKKRKRNRRKSDKRKIAEECNRDYEIESN